jgi:hypothetical protein
MEEAASAVLDIASIDRGRCRERVERLFSVDAMVDGYLDAYRAILGDRVTAAGATPSAGPSPTT